MATRKKYLPWNWRSRVEITRYDEPGSDGYDGLVTFKLMFRKGQTPIGFVRQIGELSVCDKPPHFVDEARIHEHFVKRGLGTLLYRHALNELGSLSTYYHGASDAAKGLWKRLVKILPSHRVDFFAGTLTVFPPKK